MDGLAIIEEQVIIFGGGGQANMVVSSLVSRNKLAIRIATDREDLVGNSINGYLIEDSAKLVLSKGLKFFIAIGDNKLRNKLFEKYSLKSSSLVVKDPSAIASENSFIGAGTYIGPGAIVNSGARIGENCIINSGAIIEHDVTIGNHCHIAPGSIICGRTVVGEMSLIGAGTRILDKLKISKNVIIGAGAIITKNIDTEKTVKGKY